MEYGVKDDAYAGKCPALYYYIWKTCTFWIRVLTSGSMRMTLV